MRSTRLRTVMLAGVLGATGALGVASLDFAGAADGTTSSSSTPSAGREAPGPLGGLTDEQRQCLEDNGATRPEGRPTREDRKKLKAAAKECDIQLPKHRGRHHRGPKLTDEQRQCLEDAGVTRPEGRPTQAQMDELKAAAEACGITLPTPGEGPGGPGGPGGHGPRLTDEQRECLANSGLTRPDGPPTAEQRQAFEDAAQQCGIELPARPDTPGASDTPDATGAATTTSASV